ncbi:MAG: hypothetical protein KKB70_06325 [Proteobacteria bacterium]|nr:hypothetical protein [Pseudomonadota bacterium]
MLFKKTLQLVEVQGFEHVFILSAKYGLLRLSAVIEPYNQTLSQMSILERHHWADSVWSKIIEASEKDGFSLVLDEFHFFAGQAYSEFLATRLPRAKSPLEKLKIGERLAWLNRQLENDMGEGAL